MTRMIQLGDLLEERVRLIDVEDGEEYSCGGVRLNGNGAFIREYKFGIDIKKKHVQHELRKDDVVYSTLFANKGAFAIADDAVDGAILSEKFPTFELVDDRLSLDYLRWFFRTGQLQRIAAQQVTGMAVFSLSHLSKSKFLKLKVPVPSSDRQDYVVNACNQISGAIRDCQPALDTSLHVASALFGSCIDNLLNGFPEKRMGDLGEYMFRGVAIQSDEEYKQVTVAMNNKGLRLRRLCNGIEIKSPGQCSVEEGDLLFSRIDLRNGAIGFVPGELEGAVVTRDFPVFRFHKLHPSSMNYLEYVFLSKKFKEQAIGKSRGTTGRKKLKREYFLDFTIPWPSHAEQSKVVEEVNNLQLETVSLMNGLEQQKQHICLMENAIAEKLFGADAGLH